MKKALVVLTIIALACSMVFANGANEAAPAGAEAKKAYPRFMTMGTASVGGGYYLAGIEICNVLQNYMGIQMTAQNTGGATDNNTLLQSKEVDFALTQSSMAYAAETGTKPYTAVLDNVSAMMGFITKGVFQVVTLEGNGIEKMSDLKGKIVSLGSAGGGAVNVANEVLGLLYGFTTDDVKATYSSYADAASNLMDGKVDAVIWQASIPSSGLAELVATKGGAVKFVSLTDDEVAKVCEAYPYYFRYDIQPNEYNTAKGGTTVCLNNLLVCRTDLDEDLVHDMCKTLAEHFDEIKEGYSSTKCWALETAHEVPIKLHPGAEKYYREIGLIK